MSRRVLALPPRAQAAAGAGAPPAEIDTYFDKVVKYIPADIVGAWVAVTGLTSSARDVPRQTILWVAFGIGLILTTWWTWKQAAAPKSSGYSPTPPCPPSPPPTAARPRSVPHGTWRGGWASRRSGAPG